MKRMTTKLHFVTVVLVGAYAIAGLGMGVEIGVGTEPSVSVAATWDLSPNLAFVTSFGVAFGGGVQTASYTVGVEMRYHIRLASSSVRPYLGLGASAQMGGGDISVLLTSSAGAQIHISPNIHLFGEGAVFVPVLDVSGWYWRLKLGAGFLLPF